MTDENDDSSEEDDFYINIHNKLSSGTSSEDTMARVKKFFEAQARKRKSKEMFEVLSVILQGRKEQLENLQEEMLKEDPHLCDTNMDDEILNIVKNIGVSMDADVADDFDLDVTPKQSIMKDITKNESSLPVMENESSLPVMKNESSLPVEKEIAVKEPEKLNVIVDNETIVLSDNTDSQDEVMSHSCIVITDEEKSVPIIVSDGAEDSLEDSCDVHGVQNYINITL